MAGSTPQGRSPLSQAQMELMDIVWRKGEASVTEVWQALPADRRVARTTVMTLLVRLAKRGWLKRRKVGKEFVYAAVVGKDEALGGVLSRLVNTVFDGSAANLVMTLVNARGIGREEADRLRRLIDDTPTEAKP
jgi:BlaI family penicillinase repressor